MYINTIYSGVAEWIYNSFVKNNKKVLNIKKKRLLNAVS